MQIFGPTLTGMHWHKHKVSARHFADIRRQPADAGGRRPGWGSGICLQRHGALPENVDEYMLAASFVRKRWNW